MRIAPLPLSILIGVAIIVAAAPTGAEGESPIMGGLIIARVGAVPPDLFELLLAQRVDRVLYRAE